MALRAGAALSGMEYVQFHPTTLHLPGQRSFLLTEALRGEGARLVDQNGRYFASNYHPDGEVRRAGVEVFYILIEGTDLCVSLRRGIFLFTALTCQLYARVHFCSERVLLLRLRKEDHEGFYRVFARKVSEQNARRDGFLFHVFFSRFFSRTYERVCVLTGKLW